MGTPAGFEDLVRIRYADLRRSAYHLTREWTLAEDLVQAALAQAWRAWPRVDESDPYPYVRKVMFHLFTAWWRRRWRPAGPPDGPRSGGATWWSCEPDPRRPEPPRAKPTLSRHTFGCR